MLPGQKLWRDWSDNQRIITVSQEAFDYFDAEVTQAFFVHELAHAIDDNSGDKLRRGLPGSGLDLTDHGLMSAPGEYFAEAVTLWVYPTAYSTHIPHHFRNQISMKQLNWLRQQLSISPCPGGACR